jgi:hypothetical protein
LPRTCGVIGFQPASSSVSRVWKSGASVDRRRRRCRSEVDRDNKYRHGRRTWPGIAPVSQSCRRIPEVTSGGNTCWAAAAGVAIANRPARITRWRRGGKPKLFHLVLLCGLLPRPDTWDDAYGGAIGA